jgi:hypothetical protein
MRTNTTKGVFWFAVFFLLALYTLFVSFFGLFGRSYAYAKTVDSNVGLGQFKHFVVVKNDPTTLLEKFLAKLQIKIERQEMMCGISDADDDSLSQSVPNTSENVKGKNGKSFDVHSPKNSISASDLRRQFPDAYCQKLDNLEAIILQISSQLS